MKVDSNMETARLLQRYARQRRDASMTGAKADDAALDTVAQGSHGGSSHMDADELIAYAENALPAATRMRYTGHLSDCDSCRKLVSDLVLSSGIAAKLNMQAVPQAQEHAGSWREWLAVIFAPRALRYAASVILLVGIATIALMVFRSGTDTRFRTSQAPAEESSAKKVDDGSNGNNETGLGGSPNLQSPSRPNGEISKPDTAPSPSSTPVDSLRDGQADDQKAGKDQPQAGPPASVIADGVSGEQTRTRDEDFELAQRRQRPASAAPVDKIKAKKETESATSTGQLASGIASREEADESVSSGGAKVAKRRPSTVGEDKSAASNRARSNEESAPKDANQATAMDERESRADGGRAEGTRVVGGRQFVRRDGAWVDVDYRSQATTNVRRGSDQYRALIADEPGLRTIANQLGGEVVVVWKGRAYRIY